MRSAKSSPRGDRRVVGVVGDVRHLALEQDSGLEMYLPMRQTNDYPRWTWWSAPRSRPRRCSSAIRRAPCNPSRRTFPGTISGRCSNSWTEPSRRGASWCCCSAGFAVFALMLASLGIYGVISYGVNQRTQEIGIRMALGASGRDLQLQIMLQTLRLAAAGMSDRPHPGCWRER